MTSYLTPSQTQTEVTGSLSAAIDNSVSLWADVTTDPTSDRQQDLLRDKAKAVRDFFAYCRQEGVMGPQYVTPSHVKAWQDQLTESGLSSATVYSMVSKVSSYYKWLLKDETLRGVLSGNPVDLARPKSPKPYQGSQSLSDDEVDSLVSVLTQEADRSLTGKRDYAMFLFYILTGHRREEVCRLTWGDLKKNGVLQVRFLVKGGDYHTEKVNLLCWDALTDYLTAAGRLDSMTSETPLWVGHDRSGRAGDQLSSHSFAKNLKRYARLAGLEDIHVHQLRHTVARLVGDETGDVTAVQRVLGHKNLQTTRVYLPQVSVKADTHSQAIARRLGLA